MIAWLWPRYDYTAAVSPDFKIIRLVEQPIVHTSMSARLQDLEARQGRPWEGSDLPALSSFRGEVSVKANDVRDPAVFIDSDGSRFMVYSGGGEQALEISQLVPDQ